MIRKNNPLLPICCVLLLLMTTSCAGLQPDSSAKESNVQVLSLAERRQVAEKLHPDVVLAQNRFGLRIHEKLAEAAKPGDNTLLSPYSIFTALSLAYQGSGGNTGEEMARMLGIDKIGREQANASIRTLHTLLEDAGSGVRLNSANSVWYSRGMEIKNSFIQTAKDSYHADVQAVDFAAQEAVKEINDWVSRHTRGKIPGVLDQAPAPDTRAMLLNTVYFNGAWQSPFDPKNTREGGFTLGDQTDIQVPMMKQTGLYEYKQTPEAQAIRLPYGDGRLYMLIVLPAGGRSLADVMNTIRKDPSIWQARFDHASGEIRLPRFKAESSLELNEALIAMGMKQAFDPAAADFTAMSGAKPLFVSSVRHKMVLDVNEVGTEAAAVTEMGMASSAPPTDRFEMNVDHPFFFCIEDGQTGLWLFMGTVENPA
ncbi:serpin family protein [Paenibacillus sp. FSL W8-0194]|uniref:serpin family protein n=1 Tax=Paenibacillus sp. FSL W8-0194 TaxID=2921711 RepID=UPI0030DC86F0